MKYCTWDYIECFSDYELKQFYKNLKIWENTSIEECVEKYNYYCKHCTTHKEYYTSSLECRIRNYLGWDINYSIPINLKNLKYERIKYDFETWKEYDEKMIKNREYLRKHRHYFKFKPNDGIFK